VRMRNKGRHSGGGSGSHKASIPRSMTIALRF
jgi:hypothetical protein